jgi:hypothetical protein
MADKQVKVKVDIETDIEPTVQNLKELKKQIKEVAAGSDEFKKLTQQINDTEDALNTARAGAGNLAEVLGEIPGPIGDIGGKLGGTIANLKQFSSIKISDIKGSFTELGKDLGDTAKQFSNLTGITKVYTTIQGGLSKAFSAFGVSSKAASVAARGFGAALTATGVGALVVGLGLLITNFDKVKEAVLRLIPGLADVAKFIGNLVNKFTDFIGVTSQAERDLEQFRKTSERTNETLNNEIKVLEAQGGQADKIYGKKKELVNNELEVLRQSLKVKGKLSEEEAKQFRDLKNQSEVLDAAETKRKNDIAEEDKKRRDAKSQQEADKRKQKADADKKAADAELDQIKENANAARLTLLSERDRDIAVVNDKYAKQIELAKKYNKDTTQLEAARDKEIKDLRDKFNKEDEDQLKEYNQKILQIKIAAVLDDTERQKREREAQYQTALTDLEADKEFIKKSETEKAEIRKALKQAFDNDINKIDEENNQKAIERANKLKDLELNLAQLKAQTLAEQRAAEIAAVEEDFRRRIELAKGNAAEIEALEALKAANIDKIKTDYDKKEDERRKANTDKTIQQVQATLSVLSDVANAIGAVFEMQQQKELKAAEGNAAKQEEIRKKYFEKQKKVQIANAIIQTIQSAISAFASLAPIPVVGPALGAVAAAAALVSGYANVQKIKNTTYEGASSGAGGGAGAGAGGGNSPQFNGAPSLAAPQIQTGGAQNPSSQIAQTVSAAQSRPVRAYVVSGEMSSQQALDRRTSAAATFSGG